MTLLQHEFLPTKTYPFSALRYMLQSMGILPGCTLGGDFLPTQRGAGANLSIDVAAGSAWVQGQGTARQGLYHVVNDALFNVASFTAGDGTNPRIDQVILVANDSSVSGASDAPQFVIVNGVATAGATLANRNGAVSDATLTSTYKAWMRICDVLMPVSAASVTTANIKERRPKIGGKTNIAASESTASTSYVLLGTPDQINEVVVPPDGVLVVGYQAAWQNSNNGNARAAIFLNGVQMKYAASTSPAIQEALGPAATGADVSLYASPSGLQSAANSTYTGDVTTGQIMGAGNSILGNLAAIFVAAGTYDVSVQYKVSALGTVQANHRKLWVWVEDPYNGVVA